MGRVLGNLLGYTASGLVALTVMAIALLCLGALCWLVVTVWQSVFYLVGLI